jgi:hypothetical protein
MVIQPSNLSAVKHTADVCAPQMRYVCGWAQLALGSTAVVVPAFRWPAAATAEQ